MRIKVCRGGSQEDENAIHFTHYTVFGLGYERHIAIYFPLRNTLEVHHGQARNLDKILKALHNSDFAVLKPVNVMLW